MIAGFNGLDGGGFSREIDSAVYGDDSLAAACASFSSFCRTKIDRSGKGHLVVSIFPNDAQNGRECVLAFWNFVLSTEAERRFGES